VGNPENGQEGLALDARAAPGSSARVFKITSHREVRKKHVVLEDVANRSPVNGNEDAPLVVLPDSTADFDPTVAHIEAGEQPKAR
jgi:hypothetical protein